ncbi:uncharacterized protein PHACADRAFT_129179 [Phanerochaete carnosa HHB-10118-sp]|uniref:Acyl-CoA thioesterase-like N-terminal HotDog domain-containing protein n=1 Tax=Phanerochaete carnosa (strain HHB-10118-sp) TaxID=650164 RepID=K5VX03_PHACS|nr:uncharacterized protein PHACADRAFT_129179 [Phanerochaete carnosa HHB-10118-sp]EKM51300.1 hypothetical protein PHACADRAFT_129179 [Phanerochaete carnosa HHB-10118-sp]
MDSHLGYIIGLTINAFTQSQQATQHEDPMLLTTYFLRPAIQDEFEIRVNTVRRGKQVTVLRASFIQEGSERVSTTAIFTDLSVPVTTTNDRTLRPPHPLAPQIPMYSHPAATPLVPEAPGWNFFPRFTALRDTFYDAQHSASPPQSGTKLGHWYAWKDKREQITTTGLAVFADCFAPLPRVLMEPELGELDLCLPRVSITLMMHIEFKACIPPPVSVHHSPRAVAVYNGGRLVHDPMMRHDTYVELWTAPRMPDDELPDGGVDGRTAVQEAQDGD